MSWFTASGSLSLEAATAVDHQTSVISADRKYSIKLDDGNALLEDFGNFVITAIDEVGIEAMMPIVKNIAACSVDLIAKIAAIVCERDSRKNDAADFMPPVLPHQLVKLPGREFADIVRLQIDRLSSHWSPQHIEHIELNFQDLCSAYEREPAFKQVLDQCNSKTSFEQQQQHNGQEPTQQSLDTEQKSRPLAHNKLLLP